MKAFHKDQKDFFLLFNFIIKKIKNKKTQLQWHAFNQQMSVQPEEESVWFLGESYFLILHKLNYKNKTETTKD